jgi:2-polyprenyl-3-methyl-5-hydroxy-6-metoxy-1,4-benzoquinol methylase
MHSITQCPVCQGNSFVHHLACIDHTVSHETFTIIKCRTCDLLITSPRPDQSEIGKYYQSSNYISHTTATSSLFDVVYKIARAFTLLWKIKLLKENIKHNTNPQKILDIGCGTGEFLAKCKQKGFSITGVEPSDVARANAEKETEQHIYSSLENVQGTFDCITLWHVLEHVHDLNHYVTELKNKLSKNGTIFIAVPNHECRDAQFYKEQWAGYDVPRHLWHFNRKSMTTLINNHSLRLQKVLPMKLDAFYVSMLSEKHIRKTSSTTGVLKGFLTGLNSNNAGTRTTEYSSLIYIVRK